ncbi:anti-sigma-F factor Fin [Ferroacidibacillus organovorans]|uniref:Peptide ABC transporter permease n=1 Tax=Ferroacidibacillus organovorans TaxID=1765683 RepID=A0A162TZF3_9BACL|nr:anti-sigma-F factor Fin [Ferroacidibacillus organovorans]KYP81274.1 hypothetical protein AYJ22_07995 [Ferroacidibacillus organovorans]OAG93778.1 hypothetical protein AYW79_09010 [Ferroacidibacillus organovorans]OPG16892.1 hypothetical protein B2M26_04340 [Ferroacidibacillus organovorans]
MKIVYTCRYCKNLVGEIDGDGLSASVLGFTSLTPEERADIIYYDVTDQNLYVTTVCEYCESAIAKHPSLVLEKTPLQ